MGKRTLADYLVFCHTYVGRRLSSFLLPILQTNLPVNEAIGTINTPSPRSVISASMVGQPPSVDGSIRVDESGKEGSLLRSNDEDDLYGILRKLGGGRMGLHEDPLDIIMKEKVDDKGAMLMDGMSLFTSPGPTDSDLSSTSFTTT